MRTKMTTIGSETLATIRGVHVEHSGRVPSDHLNELERFVESWIYESSTIEVETWRVEEHLAADEAIARVEAERRAVVDLGHLRFLESLDFEAQYFESVAATPIS